jgi:branched-chain amino acid aminotransferase
MITDFPVRWTTQGMGKLFDTGINLVTVSQKQIPSYLLEAKVKHRSRLHFMMANIEASKMKGKNNWPILLDEQGYITEGTGYNFFAVSNGMPISPQPQNMLMGISRQYIFEMIDCGITNMNIYDVINDAQEAFVTATPFCMLPVTSLNGVKIGNGWPGMVYTNLLTKWGINVGVDIRQQIQDWDKGAKRGTTPYVFERAIND